MTNNDLILIDGSNYFYRAFHAISSLRNSKGMPTGAVYGMMTMLKSLLAEYQPQYAAVMFDVKGKNFRHELYPDYKANRQPMPEELFVQISHTHQMVQALGFPLLMVEGVEADDVIGTLAKQAEAAGMRTLIFSGDKDFAQLVNQSITLINTIPPKLIVDYLSLVGDQADNVPGVQKVGPKTAVKWLKNYDSLDGVIKNVWKFTGKVGANLQEALPNFSLTRQLLAIKCDVPLLYTPQQLTLNPQDVNQLRQLYIELEFKTELAALPRDLFTPSAFVDSVEHANGKVDKKQYHTVMTQSDFDLWLNRLSEAELFAFDTETTSLDYLQAEIVGVSFAVQSGEAAYVPLAHDYLGVPEQLSRDHVNLY